MPELRLPAPRLPAAGAALLLLLAGCATRSVAPGPAIADMPVRGRGTEPTRTVFERSAENFAAALQASAAAPDDTALAGQAFHSGRAMLDLQCQRYLDAIGNANQAASNERKQVSLVGGFASAIMGLAGSSAKEIAGVATAFSFAGSSMDAYTSAYLFSDASRSVGKIVRDGQQVFLTAVEGQVGQLHYADAVALLTSYEAICRPAQIRALIDEAVARGTVTVERPGGDRAAEAEVASVLVALRAQLGLAVSEEDAVVLYAWSRGGSLRERIATREPVKTLLARDGAAVLDQKLSQAFLPLSLGGTLVTARWAAAVAEIHRAAAPQPATPPAAMASSQPARGTARVLRIPVLTVR